MWQLYRLLLYPLRTHTLSSGQYGHVRRSRHQHSGWQRQDHGQFFSTGQGGTRPHVDTWGRFLPYSFSLGVPYLSTYYVPQQHFWTFLPYCLRERGSYVCQSFQRGQYGTWQLHFQPFRSSTWWYNVHLPRDHWVHLWARFYHLDVHFLSTCRGNIGSYLPNRRDTFRTGRCAPTRWNSCQGTCPPGTFCHQSLRRTRSFRQTGRDEESFRRR